MGKWTAGLLIVVLFGLPILFQRSASPLLLQDSDTAVLLDALRERGDPLSWFAGDWPLGNHFYRPISTLFFEMDRALYGTNAAGYGWTNALLCFACVLALYWALKELTARVELATSGAALFALWTVDGAGFLGPIFHWGAWAALATALIPGRAWKRSLLAALVLLFVSEQIVGMVDLKARMIDWLPGRTASVMALFALLALAAYCRYERISAERLPPPEPGPLDPPATKGTEALLLRTGWPWAALACLFTALALGSYEQAVMLPALLFGAALCLRLQRIHVRWGWQAAFWGLLAVYLVLRQALVPPDVSGYQAQQFRTGPGVWTSLFGYFLPCADLVRATVLTYDFRLYWETGGIFGFLMTLPHLAFLAVANNVAVVLAAHKEWLFPLAGWAMSGVAFLPMAWLKHFDHYHYLPMALRAFFVAALLVVAGKALVSAASRPALQAPPRLDPAPGSLPRR